MTFDHYVYELIDPRDGAVFYVGKGKGDRICAHEREAAKGEASEKCDRIREIWDAGQKVERREVGRFADAASALAHESERIGWYVGLTNVTGNSKRGKSRNIWLSRDAMKVLAWWLKTTDGGRNMGRVIYEERPWATALANAYIRRGAEHMKKALAAAPFDEVAKRLRPFGVELVA